MTQSEHSSVLRRWWCAEDEEDEHNNLKNCLSQFINFHLDMEATTARETTTNCCLYGGVTYVIPAVQVVVLTASGSKGVDRKQCLNNNSVPPPISQCLIAILTMESLVLLTQQHHHRMPVYNCTFTSFSSWMSLGLHLTCFSAAFVRSQ